MNHELVNAVRSFYDAYHSRSFDVAYPYLDDEFEWDDFALGRTFQGKKGFRENMQRWLNAFPTDGRFEIVRMNVGEDFAIVECIGHGTMSGPFFYNGNEFEPTGNKMSHRICDVFRFEDGKIVSTHTYYDVRSIMEQLAVRIKIAA